MDEKYLKLIEAMAVKLGTTTEHMWSAMDRQAHISADPIELSTLRGLASKLMPFQAVLIF